MDKSEKMIAEHKERMKKMAKGHPEAKRVWEDLQKENYSEYKGYKFITKPGAKDDLGRKLETISATKGEIELAIQFPKRKDPSEGFIMLKHILIDIDEREERSES